MNAHKLITKANESSADVLFILDCFFPTKSIAQWKRDDHMTEIILAGREMHDVNGRPIAGPGNFDEGFSDAMRDILANPRGEPRQTIPRIMGRDQSLCCIPQRFWLHKPDRFHPERRVWRFFFDIGSVKDGARDLLHMRRCEVTGRRRGEFGGDPDLDNDGWGSDGGSDGGGDDDDDDDENNDDDDEARHDGGGDHGNGDGDGDSSNGGWDEVSTGLVVTELPLAKRTQRMEMVPESKTATRVPATATVSPGTGREFILHWAYQAS